MPFTFCHPAVVLPFNYLAYRWRSLTGLVAGSIAPDFEYFFRVSHYSSFSHTLPGLFWFDLPVGILISFVFHYLVRDPLILNLPVAMQKKCSHYYRFNWNKVFLSKWVIIVLSVTVGAITHLLWDGFTHETANTLKTLPFKKDFQAITQGKMNAYSLYSEVTSIVAAAIIIYAIWQLPTREPLYAKAFRSLYWSCIGVGFILAVLIFQGMGFGDSLEGYTILCIDALFLAVLLVSAVFYKSEKLTALTKGQASL